MLKLYKTENCHIYDKIKCLLNTDKEIKRTQNGKPYIDGFEFSLTHTGNTAIIAISDKPVGIDAEQTTKRNYNSILKRLTAREQSEITDHLKFLKNWVIKEAYIKMLGGTLAHDFKRLEFVDGKLLYNGDNADCNIHCNSVDGLIYAVCSKNEIPKINIETI